LSVFVSLFVCLLLVNSVPLQPTPKYITYSESARSRKCIRYLIRSRYLLFMPISHSLTIVSNR